jgi:hypothetical protein
LGESLFSQQLDFTIPCYFIIYKNMFIM